MDICIGEQRSSNVRGQERHGFYPLVYPKFPSFAPPRPFSDSINIRPAVTALTFALVPNTASSNVVKFADPVTNRRDRSGLEASELALVSRGVEVADDANGGVTSGVKTGVAEAEPGARTLVE